MKHACAATNETQRSEGETFLPRVPQHTRRHPNVVCVTHSFLEVTEREREEEMKKRSVLLLRGGRRRRRRGGNLRRRFESQRRGGNHRDLLFPCVQPVVGLVRVSEGDRCDDEGRQNQREAHQKPQHAGPKRIPTAACHSWINVQHAR